MIQEGPFLVRFSNDEEEWDESVDTLDEAISIAESGYRADQPVPEILDARGQMVFSQSELMSKFLDR